MHFDFLARNNARRRGATVIFTLVTIFVLIGFASLTLDVGALYGVRGDLQNAVDAAALSGASMLASDAMVKVRANSNESFGEISSTIFNRAQDVGLRHTSFGASGTVLASSDVVPGWIDLASSTSAINTGVSASTFNAVRVFASRSQESANGAVQFYFASIFGMSEGDVSASATAAYDDRVSGYDTDAGGAPFLPFSIRLTEYDAQVAAGSDIYDYDPSTDNVSSGSDDIPEVNLYPSGIGPGNFGAIAINHNGSVPPMREDIEEGVSPEDWEDEIGTSTLSFYDDSGNPTTYSIPGNTGLSATLQSSIETVIGEVAAFMVHDQVTGNGSNLVYRVTGIRFGRVMGVRLTGNSKGLWIQPVSYAGSGVIVATSAPSSGGAAGRIVLVR